MVDQLIRQNKLRKPDDPDDTLDGSGVSGIEASAVNQEEFWNGVLSQFKRVIHGNDSGNWHDDPTTVFGTDASLKALLSGVQTITTVDLLDNNSEDIIVGSITTDKSVVLDYLFGLPIGGRAQAGRMTFVHDGVTVNLENAYSFVAPFIEGVTFTGLIAGTDIVLRVVTSAVGENPRLKYRRETIAA